MTLAGIIPDVDGLGLVVDVWNACLGKAETYYYPQYHHFLLHGLPAIAVLAVGAALLAKRRGRVSLAVVAVMHLHLLCDFVGSRGPSLTDLWPIYYLAPITRHPMWVWAGQWRLDGWINFLITVGLMAWALALAVRRGHSFFGVVSARLDLKVVAVLRRWCGARRDGSPPA